MAFEIQPLADIPTNPTLSDHPLPNPDDHSSVDPENPSSSILLLLRQCFLIIAVIAGMSKAWRFYQPKDIFYQPRDINYNYYVTDVTLTQFDLNNTTNTLYYDLRLNLNIRNPNKDIEINYTSRLEVRAYYEDQWIAAVKLPGFHQGRKNTTVLSIVFNSHHDMVVLQGSRWLEDYYLEKSSGVFSIDLYLYFWATYNMSGTVTEEIEFRKRCNLRVPLDSSDSSGKASNDN